MHVRLIPEGGDPREDAIEDLDLATVPNVGDFIEIAYADNEFTTYEVVKRRFRINPKLEGESAFSQRVALEVREKRPYSYDLIKAL